MRARCNMSKLLSNSMVGLALGFSAVSGLRASDVRSAGEFRQGTTELDDLFRRLFRASVQRARSDQCAKRTALVAKWVYQTGAPGDGSNGRFENTPLVVDGIIYGTGQDGRVFALDARTGRPSGITSVNRQGTFGPAADE